MKTFIVLALTIVLLTPCYGYCDDHDDVFNEVGIVVSGIANITDKSEDVYGADIHINLYFLTASVEFAHWNESDKQYLRGYFGSWVDQRLANLLQWQWGYGENGHAFRIRSNIALTKKLFTGDYENLRSALLYPSSVDKLRLTPILSLYGELGEHTDRIGIGIGILL